VRRPQHYVAVMKSTSIWYAFGTAGCNGGPTCIAWDRPVSSTALVFGRAFIRYREAIPDDRDQALQGQR
jgi:hypothetical protein